MFITSALKADEKDKFLEKIYLKKLIRSTKLLLKQLLIIVAAVFLHRFYMEHSLKRACLLI